jgi:hypothetical protein
MGPVGVPGKARRHHSVVDLVHLPFLVSFGFLETKGKISLLDLAS